MTFNFSSNPFLGVLVLERIFPERQRRLWRAVSAALLVVVGFAAIYAALSIWLPSGAVPLPSSLPGLISNVPISSTSQAITFSIPYVLPFSPYIIFGLLLIIAAFRLKLVALDAYLRSRTYEARGIPMDENIARRFNLYASRLWYVGTRVSLRRSINNILWAIVDADIGRELLVRLGIPHNLYREFLAGEVHGEDIPLDDFLREVVQSAEGDIRLGDIAAALFRLHPHMNEIFLRYRLNEDVIREAAAWVEKIEHDRDRSRRWWLRDQLGRIPGIAKTWAHGYTVTIERFGYNLENQALEDRVILIGRQKEIEMLETALRKQVGANILIVGEAGTGKRTILHGLVRLIASGKVFPELEHKRVFRISPSAIIAEGKTKGGVEGLILDIFNEAARAGDIILVIDEFPEFIRSLETIGSTAHSVIGPFLETNAIHIIALATPGEFYRTLEEDKAFMGYFDKIDIIEPDDNRLGEILRDAACEAERAHKDMFRITYLGAQEIIRGARRYLVEGALPERAIDLLDAIAAEAATQHQTLVTPEFVLQHISKKTHMPLGTITAAEQTALTRLEDIMHEHVINQNAAIAALADALRRARVGIQKAERPIGTFLFLGPTGVGKTETAKTVARVYFGRPEAIIRLDMTEYQTEMGFTRLLGSAETNDPGFLAQHILTTPYAVVLLDEFEKAHPKIKDLFLQILDEGFFTNNLGQKINMRNTIIIATSNAGALLIRELVAKGTDQDALRVALLDHIQKEDLFRPELLNRFDGVIVFEPLDEAHLREVARLMLNELAHRLKEQQNIALDISPDIIGLTVKGGYQVEFGARPMRRFIQDHIEKDISDKLIAGTLKSGDTYRYVR